MRERSLDEFESIFERASIPVLDIAPVKLARISTVLTGGPLDASVLAISEYLKQRFSAESALHWGPGITGEDALELANRRQLQPAQKEFRSAVELAEQVHGAGAELILFPVIEDDEARVVTLDELVEQASPPVMILRSPVVDVAAVFQNVLHSLTGNFQQTQNFAYSFALVEEGGHLLLLHTIDESEVDDVRQSLRVSPETSQRSADEILESLAHHGQRYLKAVVAASRRLPCEVRYRLELGEVLPLFQRELKQGGYGLLVVGSHHEGASHVEAEVYQLMHLVKDVPVLAI